MREIPEVTTLDITFGGQAMKILPPWDELPEEFRKGWGNGRNSWCELASKWFFKGVKNVEFTPKPGVDRNKALRAIAACLGCFEPSHEHKIAGVGFLLSEWFEKAEEKPVAKGKKRKKGGR